MEDDQAFAKKDLVIDSKEWKRYEINLTSTRTESKSHLRVFFQAGSANDYIDNSTALCIIFRNSSNVLLIYGKMSSFCDC